MLKTAKSKTLAVMMTLGIATFAGSAIAQQGVPMQQPQQQTQTKDYSEAEIDKFVEANKVVMTIQEESRSGMMKVVEDQEGISMETFNQIAQAQQNPNASADQFSEEQMAAFEKASQKLMAKQQEMQQEMAERLPKEADISMEKFQEMMMAYRQDPQMQEKVKAKMEQ